MTTRFDFDLEQVFMRRFHSGIFFLCPMDAFVMEHKGHVYAFPTGTTDLQVNEWMRKSLHAKRNLIYEAIKNNKILMDGEEMIEKCG